MGILQVDLKFTDPKKMDLGACAKTHSQKLKGERIRAAQKRLEKTPEENNRTTGLMREIGEIQTGYEGAMGEVENYKDIAFKVVTDTYVTSDSGAGNLHQAPAFGADDHEGYKRHGVVPADVIPPCPIDDGGRFTSDVPDFQGQHVKVCQMTYQMRRMKSKMMGSR
ncbi:uncharacterized protein PGTG_01994 [Puccinia graminis f. sp. tritici CRL 75-36-700-3]|uniref:Uncharacterized protein n=1 Tax=Puccinia graminis f. sp. tritici (strain CRL 75-36-700-3 / race SCCL) TaxID=418459 RepID=E3JTM6_PUCGT|nr:uncharacterized protein PGTG_01994 [Puccinia graminis f. sp. tritici CRL 75-36-700-3]EFP75401.1 hypothetical protein PGTG_01994 [Puccinia graminis f. sp. tritici CRL 75-36-700-3]